MVRKKHLLNKIEFLESHIGKLQDELNATKAVIKDMSDKVTFVFNNYSPNAQKETNELLDEWLNGEKKGGSR